MCTQPKAIESVYWHANVRQAGFLGSIEVLGIASVGVGHIGYSETRQGQDDVRHHYRRWYRRPEMSQQR